MKRCPDCKQLKPFTEFGVNASRRDGLQFYCRSCYCIRAAASYRARRQRSGHTVRERPVVPAGHKWCPGCRTAKAFAEWHRQWSQSGGYTSYCKECRREQGKQSHLRKNYQLTTEELEHRIAAQRGLCAICRSEKPVHVDHDHKTGGVRGILCARCNLGLGLFGDRMEVLLAALDYLEGA